MKTITWKVNSCRRRHRWRPSRIRTVASEQTATPSQPEFLTFFSITQRHVYLSLLLPNYREETERGRSSGALKQLARWRGGGVIIKMLQMNISWEMKGKRRNANYVDDWVCKKRFIFTRSLIDWRGAALWTQRMKQLPREHLNTHWVKQTQYSKQHKSALKHKSPVKHLHCLQWHRREHVCSYNCMFWSYVIYVTKLFSTCYILS